MTVRLAHLSDIHFGGENAPALAAATKMLNADGFDLVVVTGDLTRYAEVVEFEAAAEWLGQIRAPTLVTPGNHDAPYLAPAERIFAPFRRYERAIGPAPAQTHLGGGFAVRGLNTARGAQPRINWSKGQISKRQVEAAVNWFGDAHPACVRIVACHHPLTEMIGGPMTARVWGGLAAARDFADARVDLVLSGHIHAPFVWPYPFADGRTYAVGAGTLSTRERGAPAGFNVVEIEGAAIRIAALGWTGSHFEPYRTWSVDRR
ncbi:metallophosphoesterase [Phenylobacterium sp.]|jgi:3',5'-cyclic AMP phosphodiesterase CpdA|uniref:metallophosphoesterase family protein n=1 Tax=Phenylobacterium sp. TaxID=1871053 RepID=UPI002E32E806|nr:metallophosphoesterase [Phenylobacterium sp.]HEX4712274.1 metallophosphoesterase [Phenylobacterium sp.]